MHILGVLVAAIGVIGVILWRLHMAAEAAKGLAETAGEARGLVRRWKWRGKLANDPLDLIQDPREAAIAIMVAIAQSDGALTERERCAILAEATKRFGATDKQAEELLAHGRWLTREVRDPDNCIRKLAPILRRTCGPVELADTVEMASRVASAEGPPAEIEAGALSKLRQALAV